MTLPCTAQVKLDISFGEARKSTDILGIHLQQYVMSMTCIVTKSWNNSKLDPRFPCLPKDYWFALQASHSPRPSIGEIPATLHATFHEAGEKGGWADLPGVAVGIHDQAIQVLHQAV